MKSTPNFFWIELYLLIYCTILFILFSSQLTLLNIKIVTSILFKIVLLFLIFTASFLFLITIDIYNLRRFSTRPCPSVHAYMSESIDSYLRPLNFWVLQLYGKISDWKRSWRRKRMHQRVKYHNWKRCGSFGLFSCILMGCKFGIVCSSRRWGIFLTWT